MLVFPFLLAMQSWAWRSREQSSKRWRMRGFACRPFEQKGIFFRFRTCSLWLALAEKETFCRWLVRQPPQKCATHPGRATDGSVWSNVAQISLAGDLGDAAVSRSLKVPLAEDLA